MYLALAQKIRLNDLFYDKLGDHKFKGILVHPLFLSGMVLKLLVGSLFASTFLAKYFIPFVDYFVDHGFSNPYEHFYAMNASKAFPYPALMLYFLAVPKWLFGNFLSPRVTYHIPLLFADMTILFILRRWLKQININRLLWLYWLSPLSMYICYMHSQLDVIPIAMLCLSIYFLFKEKTLLSFTVLGLAIACKTSVFLACPFFCIYLIFHPTQLRIKCLAVVALLLAFILPNLPYLTSPAFFAMVFQNSEQHKLFNLAMQLGGVKFYVVPAVYLILVFTAISLKIQSKTLFIMFLGFAFGSILLFSQPMPGWYFWMFPFFCYFYAAYTHRYVWLFMLLQLAYFLYFGLSPQSDFLSLIPAWSSSLTLYGLISHSGSPADLAFNLSFTLLQTLLFLNCYTIYRRGIRLFSHLPLASKPYLIGIGGNSGAGKTTLSQHIMGVFSKLNTTIISGDDMHKWERGDQQWQQLTHLNPKANELHSEYEFLSRLKNGYPVKRRSYNHDTGAFDRHTVVRPNKLTVLEGLHPFYIENVRNLFDLRIFLKPDESLATQWKIERDTSKRGYSKEKILAQIAHRQTDFNKYILPQEKHANMVIELIPEACLAELSDAPHMQLCLTLDNTIHVEFLLQLLITNTQLKISHDYIENDKQVFKMSGDISAKDIETISYMALPRLDEMGINQSDWQEGVMGLLQLIITYIILEQVDRGF